MRATSSATRGLIALVIFLAITFAVIITPLLRVSQQGQDDLWGTNRMALERATDLYMLTGWQRKREAVTESYVISFSEKSVDEFRVRNDHSSLGPVLHVPAMDGYSQRTLNLWGEIAKQPPLNASRYDPDNPKQRSAYKSPHAVGCHLSHWNLWRYFHHRAPSTPELLPLAYLVFEDDSSCVPNVRERVLEVVRHLPPDWDMLFLGGKPFTRLNGTMPANATELEILRQICEGKFGFGDSPLAPDGTRNLSSSLFFWQTRYILNTNALVINPQRAGHIAEVLKPKNYVPIDVYLSTKADANQLRIFMTSEKMCIQPRDVEAKEWEATGGIMNTTEAWEGFYWFANEGSWDFQWGKMVMDGCEGRY